MRIMWLGNAPWSPSGYGEQAALFLPRFRDAGHEVAVSCNFGMYGTVMEWQGIPVYPSDNAWGNKTIGTYAADFEPDLIIALCDAWVLQPNLWPEGVSAAVWAPVDHYPLPPMVLGVLAHQRIRPIAMSRDGEEWMRRFRLDPMYVPHGVDREVFKPQPELRDDTRDMLGVDRDAFLVGMVAANKAHRLQPRKGFPQAFHAFSLFSKNHPDAIMYVHTDSKPTVGENGVNLETLAAVLGLTDKILFANEEAMQLGIARESVAATYQAFDVLLNPSYGEGFGIPIIEAQACGIPVICSQHSAMTELTHAGWLVDGDPWWDPLQESFFFMPSIQSIADKLEVAYDMARDADVKQAASKFADRYEADKVMAEHWTPTLAALSRPREVPPLNGQPKANRAQRRRLAKAAK